MKKNCKIAVFQDLAGHGRCSLSVSLPVLSAFGAEVCACPSSVFSTQTDGYEHYAFVDLSDNILPTARHWKKIGLTFDAILTGFLPSEKAADAVLQAIKLLRTDDTLLVVDPVLGDGGQLYSSCKQTMIAAMRALCAKADYCTPNLTEARLLCDLRQGGEVSAEELHTIFEHFPGFGARVITGIEEEDRLRIAYQRRGLHGDFRHAKIASHYVGTGDCFTSVLTGALLSGDELPDAVKFAAQFVEHCVSYTRTLGTAYREGLAFEPYLSEIIRHT